MAAITATEVFDFMGTETTVRTNNTGAITALIGRGEARFESITGRKVNSTAFTNLYLENNVNCKIFKEKLFLTGIYRDTYSITALSEEGTELTAVAAYDDDNDYIFDSKNGILIRKNSWWSTATFAMKISGATGLVDPAIPANTKEDVKQLLIEWVARMCGLWKVVTITEDGSIETVRRDENEVNKKIRTYSLLVI
jgi:hypothetical protein